MRFRDSKPFPMDLTFRVLPWHSRSGGGRRLPTKVLKELMKDVMADEQNSVTELKNGALIMKATGPVSIPENMKLSTAQEYMKFICIYRGVYPTGISTGRKDLGRWQIKMKV